MSEKVKVPCKVPALENSRVFKEECIFCFQTPEHDDGLYLCLVTHFGYCPEHLKTYGTKNSTTTTNPGFLHCQRTRRRKKSAKGEPEQKITKLAIGVEGGLQEAQDEFEDKYELVIFPNAVKYQLNDAKIDEGVRSCCDALIACQSASRLQELASLAGTWDGSFVVPTKHVELPQLEPAPKIPPSGWRCQAEGCDKTDNLWMNLTDGKILCGRKFHDGMGFTGGNNHAIEHFHATGFPLAVKLGTISAHGQADVFSYDEDEMVMDPNLEQHLAHFGISMKAMEKTDKTMLELELDYNKQREYSRICESDRDLKPAYGPGFTGLINLGSTCYMNSALQTLALVPEVQRAYTGESADKIFRSFPINADSPSNPSDNLSLQCAKLFDGLLSGKFSKEPPKSVDENIVLPGSAVRPLAFRHLVGKGHPEFASARQQDVEEYLRWFFGKLEQPVVGGESAVDAIRFEVLEHLHCQKTGRNGNTRRPETILSLPVPLEKAINADEFRKFEEKKIAEKAAGRKVDDVVFLKIPMRACLEAYAAPCIIENARCPFDDKQSTTLTKTQYLSTFPDYLFVQLKKFTINPDWTPKKLDVEIVLDDPLNIESLGVPDGMANEGEPMDTTPPSPKAKAQPEPTAEELAAISQLMDAGFPNNACKKAYRISAGRMDAAFDWLLAHVGDADFDQAEEAAPAVAVGQGQQASPNDAKLIDISNMGFTRDQGRKALRLANGNLEQAIGWLLDNAGDPGESEAPAAAAAQVQPGRAAVNKYRNGPGKYRLIGFISHMGPSSHSGHYVCHLLKKIDGVGERWVIFNDEKVAFSEEPPKGLGYVYLYERIK